MKNIQEKAQEIHSQYGTSEMANYKIQLLFEEKLKNNNETFKQTLECYKECFELFIPIEKWDEASLFIDTHKNNLAKELSKK
jgi:isocitrate dehydrogenase kinase/phosphatase